MFLVERVFGQFVYVAILFYTVFLLTKLRKKDVSIILNIYILLISIMAFLFVPNIGSDLGRLQELSLIYSSMPLTQLSNYLNSTTTPLSIFYLYLFGKTGIPGLLPSLTVVIVYSNIFYIIKKQQKVVQSGILNVALTLLFIMSSSMFMETLSNIRTMLVFSFLAKAFYKEFFEDKSIFSNIYIYILCSLVHEIAIMIVLIRVAYELISNSPKKHNMLKRGSLLFLSIIVMTFSTKYLKSMIVKIQEYINIGGYFELWEVVAGLIGLVLMIYITKLHRDNQSTSSIPIKYTNFLLGFNILNLITLVEYNTFHRLNLFNYILFIPILLRTNSKNLIINNKKSVINTILFASLIILLISITRGNQSSLKFFLLNK